MDRGTEPFSIPARKPDRWFCTCTCTCSADAQCAGRQVKIPASPKRIRVRRRRLRLFFPSQNGDVGSAWSVLAVLQAAGFSRDADLTRKYARACAETWDM